MATPVRPGRIGAGIWAWAAALYGVTQLYSAVSPDHSAVTNRKPVLEAAAIGSSADQPESTFIAPPLVTLSLVPEEQSSLRRALDRVRQDAETAARIAAEQTAARLSLLEQSLALQRRRELETLQDSHHSTLIIAGALAAVGVLGMFCLAFFLMRATSRLTEVALSVGPAGRALVYGLSPAAPSDPRTSTAPNPAEEAGARFLTAIEQLEKRLLELEHTAENAGLEASRPHSNGGGSEAVLHEAEPVSGPPAHAVMKPAPEQPVLPAPAVSRPISPAELLLGKGQALLNLDQPAEALACFDEAIATEPANAEAFLKKGAALELLRLTDEALECYDRALAVDSAMTTAYLCKGGLFNRLARYEEALQCYELALQSEQRTTARSQAG